MGKGARILVVEDNFMNKVLVREMLVLHGYEVLEAETGEEAVEMAVSEKPDLILMDINLPVMDGVKATKIIKEKEGFADMFIVAITATAMKGTEQEIIDKGFDGYVAKPIDLKKLLDAIEKGLA